MVQGLDSRAPCGPLEGLLGDRRIGQNTGVQSGAVHTQTGVGADADRERYIFRQAPMHMQTGDYICRQAPVRLITSSGATRSRRCYCNALCGVTLPAMLLAVSYRDVRYG